MYAFCCEIHIYNNMHATNKMDSFNYDLAKENLLTNFFFNYKILCIFMCS